MSWNINLETDWLRFDNSGATNSYYGYNRDPSSLDTSNSWAIRQLAGTGPINIYWNNGAALSYEVQWSNRANYFGTPGTVSITATASGGFGPSIGNIVATGTYSNLTANATGVYAITFNWTGSTSSSRYYFTAYRGSSPIMNFQDGGDNLYNPNQNTFVKQMINNNSVTIANCPGGFTYSGYIYVNNGFGTSSTLTTSIYVQ